MLTMKNFLKRFVQQSLISSVALLGLTATVSAAGYPEKPITMLVAYGPGGGTDLIARLIAPYVEKYLGNDARIIVSNKAGAGGAIGFTELARATPDGYTIGFLNTPNLISIPIERQANYTWRGFDLIGNLVDDPGAFTVNSASPMKDLKDLVAYAKANPGKVTVGSTGVGSDDHLAMLFFERAAGVKMTHVPYKGSAPAIVDTIGGTTQVMFPSLFSAYPQVAGGKLKALGIAGDKRSSVLPNVPTLKEQGIPNMNVTQWYALFAPAKTPKPIIDRLNKELNLTLNEKANEKKIEDQGAEVETGTPEQLKNLVQKELVRWKKLVDSAKITAD
jgi:tripartite-type tricarboxylate transporter receptor subunit TctC